MPPLIRTSEEFITRVPLYEVNGVIHEVQKIFRRNAVRMQRTYKSMEARLTDGEENFRFSRTKLMEKNASCEWFEDLIFDEDKREDKIVIKEPDAERNRKSKACPRRTECTGEQRKFQSERDLTRKSTIHREQKEEKTITIEKNCEQKKIGEKNHEIKKNEKSYEEQQRRAALPAYLPHYPPNKPATPMWSFQRFKWCVDSPVRQKPAQEEVFKNRREYGPVNRTTIAEEQELIKQKEAAAKQARATTAPSNLRRHAPVYTLFTPREDRNKRPNTSPEKDGRRKLRTHADQCIFPAMIHNRKILANRSPESHFAPRSARTWSPVSRDRSPQPKDGKRSRSPPGKGQKSRSPENHGFSPTNMNFILPHEMKQLFSISPTEGINDSPFMNSGRNVGKMMETCRRNDKQLRAILSKADSKGDLEENDMIDGTFLTSLGPFFDNQLPDDTRLPTISPRKDFLENLARTRNLIESDGSFNRSPGRGKVRTPDSGRGKVRTPDSGRGKVRTPENTYASDRKENSNVMMHTPQHLRTRVDREKFLTTRRPSSVHQQSKSSPGSSPRSSAIRPNTSPARPRGERRKRQSTNKNDESFH